MAPSIAITELVVADGPAAWDAAGFAVTDGGSVRVGDVDIRCTDDGAAHGILSWGLAGIDPDGLTTSAEGGESSLLDGLPTRATPHPAPVSVAPRHPNGAVAIDHLVIVTPDLDRTTIALERCGFSARRTRTDDRGAAPRRQRFFRAGPVIVEVVGPTAPQGSGPAAFFGLAYTVAELDATVAWLGPLAGRPRDAVQPGRRIVMLRQGPLTLSTPTAFLSASPSRPTGPGAG